MKNSMNRKVNNNGYNYVDLDLPSHTLWATCNIGSEKPTDTGLYFQWADTKGWTSDQIGVDKWFDWESYKFHIDGNAFKHEMLTKYIIKDQQLELQDDAAHIIMKGDWHMPSPDQIKELISNTINKWIEKDGIYGMEFISKKDPKKLIFIPAVGGAWYNYIYYDNISVHVWSSGLSYGKFAKYLYIDKDGASLNDCDGRHSGLQIRGVIDMKDDNKSKNENLDLTQVLKGVPKGTKLWSSVYGNCTFMNIDLTDVIYPINCQVTSKFGKSTYIGFTKDGRIDINYDNSRCVLFPSEQNHDWSTFVVPKNHKEFKLNQKVLVGLAMNNQYIWRRDIYLNYDENKKCHCTFYESMVPDSLIIPYDPAKDGKPVPTKYYMCSCLDNKNRPKFSD